MIGVISGDDQRPSGQDVSRPGRGAARRRDSAQSLRAASTQIACFARRDSPHPARCSPRADGDKHGPIVTGLPALACRIVR